MLEVCSDSSGNCKNAVCVRIGQDRDADDVRNVCAWETTHWLCKYHGGVDQKVGRYKYSLVSININME